ncbi:MAG: nitrite reductase, partial [Hydrogenophaga sp.]|nr:nitrite reductase [Hydrogenophaga sp.]
QEWYQITLAGSDGSALSGPTVAGKVVGPSFAANEVTEAIEAILDTYRAQRHSGENFITALKRIGHDPFKAAANGVRVATARAPALDAA